MENCCYKCQSTEGLKRYGFTEEGFIVSEEEERMMRTRPFCIIFLAFKKPRIVYDRLCCPKCAKSGSLFKNIFGNKI